MKRYTISLDGGDIDAAIANLTERKLWVKRKTEELCRRLVEIGVTKARLEFARAIYKGNDNVTVTSDGKGTKYTVRANGEAVLFIEFGSGIRYGSGHPANAEYGMGPGTWSDGPQGKGHWNDPDGWYLPKEKGGGHSYGNPPAMAMYGSVQYLKNNLERIAREVFSTD